MGMKLTDEQRRVVEIDAGSHLVLAPPGSGKTEILSQRILHAMRTGVNPERMLCATFTNRAAYEMRARVEAQGAGVALPEVGNLHHFCFRFLRSVGRLSPAKHVLDDCEQLSFAKEVVDVLREELKTGKPCGKETHGVTVLRSVKGVVKEPSGPINELRVGHLHGLLEEYFASCAEKDRSPYPAMLSAMLIAHQRRMGIPLRYLRAMPPELYELDGEGVVRALSGCYAALKRRSRSVDFDDLINEAYLYLEKSPLPDERRFRWVMIDEVQDLNPLQWQIVRGLTSKEASKTVESGNGPIVRMALKVMRHDLDRASLRRRYLEMARSLAVPFDCLETLVDCLSGCFGRDLEVLGVIRMMARASARSDVCSAALRYACLAAEEASLRADAMAAMSDVLYCRSAELRVAAATALLDLGEGRWAGAVKGTAGDFERLGRIAAPSHDAALREIIVSAERNGDSAYGRRLRRVVFLRAARVGLAAQALPSGQGQALPSGQGLALPSGQGRRW